KPSGMAFTFSGMEPPCGKIVRNCSRREQTPIGYARQETRGGKQLLQKIRTRSAERHKPNAVVRNAGVPPAVARACPELAEGRPALVSTRHIHECVPPAATRAVPRV